MNDDQNTPQETTVRGDFDPETEIWGTVGSPARSGQLISGAILSDLADHREDIRVLTADLGRPTQVHTFAERHPESYFNFGIAETNTVSAAAGLASTGMKPYVSGFGFFLGIIAAEQIRTDICYTHLPVRMLGTHSGISMGALGTSHHATEDISILRSMADLTILAPIDAVSLRRAIEVTVDHPGPVYFRLGSGEEGPVYEEAPGDWRVGGSCVLHEGEDATIFATGICVNAALTAAKDLAGEGLSVRVVDAYSLKPLDREAIERAARETDRIFTAEEHNIVGGLGSAVAEVLAEDGSATPLTRIGVPDEYSLLGPPTHLYRHYGLDAEGIAATVRDALSST